MEYTKCCGVYVDDETYVHRCPRRDECRRYLKAGEGVAYWVPVAHHLCRYTLESFAPNADQDQAD